MLQTFELKAYFTQSKIRNAKTEKLYFAILAL